MTYFYFLALIGLFASLNVSLFIPFGFYDSHRLLQIGVTIFTSLSLLFMKYRYSFHSRNTFVLALLLMVLVCLSNQRAVYTGLGFLDTLNTLFLIATLLCFSTIWKSDASLKLFEEWFVLVPAIGLLIYFAQMLIAFGAGVHADTSVDRSLIVHHISNVRFLNHIQVLTLPILVVFSLRSKFLASRRLCFFVSVLSVSVLFFLSARAAIVSFCIAAFIISFLTKDRVLIFRFFSTILFGGLFFLLVFKGIPVLVYGLPEVPLAVNLNSSGRWELWGEGLLLLKEHWLLGVGGMQYGYWSQLGFGHPHNLALQIALEYGVPVLFIVLFFVCRFLIYLVHLLRKNEFSSFQIACCWAFVAALGVAMFSGVWVAPLTQLLLVLVVAPLIGPYVSSHKASRLAHRRINLPFPPPLWAIKCGLLFVIISFVVLLFNEIKRHQEIIDFSNAEKPLNAPRFWQESTWPKLKTKDS